MFNKITKQLKFYINIGKEKLVRYSLIYLGTILELLSARRHFSMGLTCLCMFWEQSADCLLFLTSFSKMFL